MKDGVTPAEAACTYTPREKACTYSAGDQACDYIIDGACDFTAPFEEPDPKAPKCVLSDSFSWAAGTLGLWCVGCVGCVFTGRLLTTWACVWGV